MFSKHPKGLIAAALANLGERFGFYTMMAILVLFLQAKFGLDGKSAGFIYSTFYFSIYILALVGGIIADKTRNYKGTITLDLHPSITDKIEKINLYSKERMQEVNHE